MPKVTADWARFSCFAAFEKLPVSLTARKIRIWSRVRESNIIRYIEYFYQNFISFLDYLGVLDGGPGNQPHRSRQMPTLLAIEVSPCHEFSTSRKLTALFIDRWKAARPGAAVVVRDLMRTPPPFVDLAWVGGASTPREQHSPKSAAAIKVSDGLVAELKAADHIVIGTPMFNFSIPAVLKAYIDQIVRVGVTVSPNNVGLLTGKKATVILASGGDFSPGSPVEKYNQASGYLRQVLRWIGISDVEIILANRARAGAKGETAVEEFGAAIRSAAAAAPAIAA